MKMENKQEEKVVRNVVSAMIREAIDDSGLTLKQLEDITGLSKSAIQRYASCDTEKIPLYAVFKIAQATKTKIFNTLFFSLDIISRGDQN